MVRSDRSASGDGLDYIGTIVSTLVQPVESVLMNPLCVSRTNAVSRCAKETRVAAPGLALKRSFH
jgi:hypothetical protein